MLLTFFSIDTMSKSMVWCKTAVTPLLTHWSYCSLALSHRNCLHLVPKSRWAHGELHASVNDKLHMKFSKNMKIFFQAMRVMISTAMNHHVSRPQCAEPNKGIKSEVNLDAQWRRISHFCSQLERLLGICAQWSKSQGWLLPVRWWELWN